MYLIQIKKNTKTTEISKDTPGKINEVEAKRNMIGDSWRQGRGRKQGRGGSYNRGGNRDNNNRW